MSFERPLALALLVLVPLYYLLKYYKVLKEPALAMVLYDWGEARSAASKPYHEGLVVRLSLALRLIVHILAAAVYVLLVLSIAGPIRIHNTRVLDAKGLDLVFVLDTSSSMSIKDMALSASTSPEAKETLLSRLEASKLAIETLVSGTMHSSYALIVYGDESAFILPLTKDKAALRASLKEVHVGTLGLNSALGEGLASAAYHIGRAPSSIEGSCRTKAVVLFSDGENNAGRISPDTIASLLGDMGVRLYAIGVGRGEEYWRGKGGGGIVAPFEYKDYSTGKKVTGYAKASLNDEALSSLCAKAKGSYYRAYNILELKRLLESIARETSKGSYKEVASKEQLNVRLLKMAVLCLLIAAALKYLVLRDIN